MDKTLSDRVWEEIHGFSSLSEYNRFILYIESQVASGVAQEDRKSVV